MHINSVLSLGRIARIFVASSIHIICTKGTVSIVGGVCVKRIGRVYPRRPYDPQWLGFVLSVLTIFSGSLLRLLLLLLPLLM